MDFDKVTRAKANDYSDFICFAFIYPMIEERKMKDYHDDNVKYPVEVKSYSRKNGVWNLISKQKVNSLSGLSRFEIEEMYKYIKR